MRSRQLALALATLLAACQSAHSALNVVADVDLERYSGTWYEIASFPQHFQRGCVATRAHYELRADGKLGITNECRDKGFDGKLRRAEGVAWIANPSQSHAKLKVQFFWPFRGDYWIIELDPNYGYAAVGHPSRDYLWIIARTPTMDRDAYAQLLERIEAHGYALDRLQETLQPSPP